MTLREKFMVIIPPHRRVLERLLAQKLVDALGMLGKAAVRGDNDVLTLAELTQPLLDRGMIEDLTKTEMGASGRLFLRITRIGELCLDMGVMLRDARCFTIEELSGLAEKAPAKIVAGPVGYNKEILPGGPQ